MATKKKASEPAKKAPAKKAAAAKKAPAKKAAAPKAPAKKTARPAVKLSAEAEIPSDLIWADTDPKAAKSVAPLAEVIVKPSFWKRLFKRA
jgi:hypothetical protein